MKRFRVVFITLAVLTNIGIGVAAVAQTAGNKMPATTHCSAASLKGDYGMAGQGFLARFPLAFVGVLHFDGVGRFSGHHEESIGGNYGPSAEAATTPSVTTAWASPTGRTTRRTPASRPQPHHRLHRDQRRQRGAVPGHRQLPAGHVLQGDPGA